MTTLETLRLTVRPARASEEKSRIKDTLEKAGRSEWHNDLINDREVALLVIHDLSVEEACGAPERLTGIVRA